MICTQLCRLDRSERRAQPTLLNRAGTVVKIPISIISKSSYYHLLTKAEIFGMMKGGKGKARRLCFLKRAGRRTKPQNTGKERAAGREKYYGCDRCI